VIVSETTAADEAAGWVRRKRYFADGPEHVDAVVPWDQVATWRITCECGWTGPERPAVTDPEYGMRDCPTELEDEVFYPAWRQHIAPFDAIAELRGLAGQLHRLEDELADKVALARTAGASWTQIGREVGLTRQGAQQRWGAGVLEPST
jgi:hypothetical protein